jgi:hypothetical protein
MTTINLTPGKDTIDVASSVTPVWITGDSATYNASDSITGNDLTTLRLSLDDTATTGSPTVDGVGAVRVSLGSDVTLNAADYHSVGDVALVGGGVAGSTLTIDNASRSTVYAIDTPHTQYDLEVNLSSGSGPAQLSFAGSGVWGSEADNVGLSFAGSTVSIEAANYRNFDAIALGGNVGTVDVGGAGQLNAELSGLAATFTLDASATSANDTFQFASGVLKNSDTVMGGIGVDTVVADGFSGPDAQLHLTDVSKLVTAFTGDVTFSGTDISGLRTVVATEIGGGAVTLIDMTNDFKSLTINGDVGAVSAAYGETAAAKYLEVTYATGSDSSAQAFAGVEVDNVANLAAVFKADVDMTGAAGAVTLDNLATTAVSLNSAGGHDAYAYLTSDAAVNYLTVKATTYGSTMELENNGSSFYAFNSTHDVHSISVLASGQNSTAKIDSNWSGDILVGGHLNQVTITASGENAYARATATTGSGPFAAAIVAENGIGSVAVKASGVSSDAHVGGYDGIYSSGDIGSVTVSASAMKANAEILADEHAVIAEDANIGAVTVTASGQKADAEIATTSDGAVVAFGGFGETASGNIGPVAVLAGGTSSDAHISGGESGIYADNTIASVSVTASGAHAGASIQANYAVYAEGDIGGVTVTASGVLSHAAIDGETGVYAEDGSVGVVQVVASASSAHAEISGGSYGVYAYSSIGGSAGVSITASAAQASAEIDGSDAAVYAQGGDIGAVTLIASGQGSEAGVNPAFSGTWGGVDGDNGLDAEAGSIGAIVLTASGVSSDAHIVATTGTAAYAADGIASLTITASGANSAAYVVSHSSSAVSSPGPIGALSITASGSYAVAEVIAYDGTGIRSANDSIGTLALTASGAHSEAIIFGGGIHGGGNNAVSAYSTLGAVTLKASGAHSLASIDSTTAHGIYVGGVDDDVALPGVTLTASALDAHAQVVGGSDSEGVYVGEGNVGAIVLTASGTGSASSSADHAYAYIGGYSGVVVDDGSIGSVTLKASGTYAEAGIQGSGDGGDGVYANSAVTHVNLTASGAHSTAYIDGYYGLAVEDGGVSTIGITASGLDSGAYIGTTSDGYNYVDGNVGQISVTADGAGSHAGLDWLDVDGAVAQVSVTASAAGSSAYAELDPDAGDSVAAIMVSAGTGGKAYYEQESGVFGTITVATGKAGVGGADAGGASLSFDGLYAQTYSGHGGVINASGGQDLSIRLYDDSDSFSSLNAGSMTGNVTVQVEAGSGDQGMTITTGSGNDDVQVGTGANTLNLGTGNDTYDFRNVVEVASPNAILPVAGAENFITANGWSSNDTLVFAGDNGSATGAYMTIGDNATTFGLTGTLEAQANSALTTHHGTMTSGVDVGGLQYVFGTSDGNGYLFFDPSHDNTGPLFGVLSVWEFQQAIELVGVTSAPTAAQIHGA